MGPAIEHVRAALDLPDAHCVESVNYRHEGGGSIGHGGVDDLPFPRFLGFEQRAGHSEGEHHPAAAEIAYQVQRGYRTLTVTADGVQRARE